MLVVVATAPAAAEPAAAGPGRLIRAFESTPALLVGTVSDVEPVLHGGWIAAIDVERVLRGRPLAAKSIEVAWEEPVPELPSRLEIGRRILFATGPMSTSSIWKQRVPDALRRNGLLSIADDASAFIERPSGAELADLEHYLALSSDARRGNAGVVYLSALASRAQPRLAISALATLNRLPGLSRELAPGSAAHICDALMREGREASEVRGTAESDVSDAALALVERRRLKALRQALNARIAALEPNVPAVLYAALGAIDGRMPDEIALELLASDSIEHRLAAARWANGEKGLEQIRHLLRWDSDAGVRAAAVQRLLELESIDGLDDAIRSLEDPASEVRLAAIQSIATIDPEAIRDLKYVVETGSLQGARSAIVTLSMMGVEAHKLLYEISEQHPDKSVRALAGVAVGKPLGHVD
jgi:hypothetical protein